MKNLSFRSPWYGRNSHFQTVIGPVTRMFGNSPPYEEMKIPIDEHLYLVGKFWGVQSTKSLVLLYHGLGGTEDSKYVLGCALALYRAGFSVSRMRLRGAEQKPPYLPSLYHSGLTEDIERAVDYYNDKGFEHIFIVAFSLSGNIVLKWLGEGRRNIRGAFVVSPPVNLDRCTHLLNQKRNIIYQNHILRHLKYSIQQKSNAFPERFSSYNKTPHFKSIRAFDDNITAPFHGFENASHYYETCASEPFLQHIENDVTIVHAEDDPFVSSEEFEKMAPNLPANINLNLMPQGGHVGFFEGFSRGYAVDRWVVDYVRLTSL